MPRSAPDLLAELRELVAAHADAGVATPVEGVLLGKVERSMTPEYSLADPVLVVMAQGGKRLMLGDRVHEYRAGDFLIVTASVPVTGHFFDATPEAPALAMGLVLRPSVIASLLLEAPARSSARRDAPLPAIAVGEATDELLDAAVRMVRLLDHPADAAVLAPLVEREHEPLHLPSPFPRGAAMSPLQFQKRIRLQEARSLLLARPDDIAGVGHLVGYDRTSQFSREYRRLFGAPPGQDAARLRATTVPDTGGRLP
jgi:hypothetical protein